MLGVGGGIMSTMMVMVMMRGGVGGVGGMIIIEWWSWAEEG